MNFWQLRTRLPLPGRTRESPILLTISEIAMEHPVRTILVGIALTVTFVVGLGKLELRTDGAAIYPLGNSTVRRTEKDRRTFQEPERVVLLVTSKEGGPAVQSPEGFRYLQSVHGSLDALPVVQGDGVRSLADLLAPPGGPDSPYVHPFLETIPDSVGDFDRLLGRLRDHPLTDGLFLSIDGRAAAVYIPLVEGENRQQQVAELERWIGTQAGESFALRLTGPVIAEARLGDAVLRDLAWLTPLMVAAVAILLFFSLRTMGGVTIAMVEVLMVLIWTLGAMAYCGVPVTLVTTILPVVLMAMAVTDEIHLIERFQAHLDAIRRSGTPIDRRPVQRAMKSSLHEIHHPIVVTSLTTALAFLSFTTASMVPLRHFGTFTAAGILLAMVMSFTLIPALAVRLPVSWFEPRWSLGRGGAPAPTTAVRLLARHSGQAALLGVLVVLVCAPGLGRLAVQDSWIDNFDPRSDVVSAERDFNAAFWGSYWFDVVLEAPEEAFFHHPEGVALMEELTRQALLGPEVGGLVTYLVPFEIVAEAWGEQGVVSSLPPATFHRISAWVRLIKNRIDLHQYITEDARAARVRILVNNADYRKGQTLSEHLARVLTSLPQPPGLEYHFSGHLPLAVEVVRAIVSNQLRSIAWTLIGVGVLLTLIRRSITRAAILMVPVVAGCAMVFGAMGYAGWPLGIATSMFAALTLGVGVDFALHFSHRYQRERAAGADHPQAVIATLTTTGRALRWSTLVLSLGFLVLSLSALKPNHSLGVLLAAALTACYGTTLLFLPWLLDKMRHSAGDLIPTPR